MRGHDDFGLPIEKPSTRLSRRVPRKIWVGLGAVVLLVIVASSTLTHDSKGDPLRLAADSCHSLSASGDAEEQSDFTQSANDLNDAIHDARLAAKSDLSQLNTDLAAKIRDLYAQQVTLADEMHHLNDGDPNQWLLRAALNCPAILQAENQKR